MALIEMLHPVELMTGAAGGGGGVAPAAAAPATREATAASVSARAADVRPSRARRGSGVPGLLDMVCSSW